MIFICNGFRMRFFYLNSEMLSPGRIIKKPYELTIDKIRSLQKTKKCVKGFYKYFYILNDDQKDYII